jgi:hypothetical protein
MFKMKNKITVVQPGDFSPVKLLQYYPGCQEI